MASLHRPERTTMGGSLEIPRMLNGLWQLAGGHDDKVDILAATAAMDLLIEAGLDTFDMADHYGDAELVIGQHRQQKPTRQATAFTKWCPAENGIKSFEQAEAAVDRALTRMGQGLTNVDATHLELLIRSGYSITTNQVSCSVIDRRLVRGRLSHVCAEHRVGILAYGTLLGGFLSENWLGQDEPQDKQTLNWSLRKYLRFIHTAGGWASFQRVLQVLAAVAGKHQVSIAAVATRWVLDVPVVSAVIVGSRLSKDSGKYTASNLAAFSFSLDDEDRELIVRAQEGLRDIPGDCGDEYRRPPFLTATGDLRDHIKGSDDARKVSEAIAKGQRVECRSGGKWEAIAGYSRAVRIGDTIQVSGTTTYQSPGFQSSSKCIGGNCPRSQTVAVLDIIARSIKKLGGNMSDVVRTRVIIRNEEDCQAVSEAHGWVFKCEGIRPSNTLTTAGLIGEEFLVEIEAEAVVGSGAFVLLID
ncbi:NADP-dependent oxidoreductase domain-containing protein [Pseudomassariella vexata]|uniref:NADP-dependent oxidoreductase domain-containing protein n=1 Tax=Pseudomassariella vexata TaxID=1141098 RepID=A0A1Y2DF23_9PEZI|nr:NADP-dependent oxidoreductase domain-containing protein [Pseudomassariella vexata]ORY57726.1 NADP-dependent oxidoreductase domain-containing protein [Pseudomassariella vexata]